MVFPEESFPFLLGFLTAFADLGVTGVHFIRNVEGLLCVKAKLGLELLNIVRLEGLNHVSVRRLRTRLISAILTRAVNTLGTLLLGSKSDSGSDLDHRRLIRHLLGRENSVVYTLQITI